MALLEPITFLSAPVRQADTAHPVIPGTAEDVSSCSFSPSPKAGSMTHNLQRLVISSGVNSTPPPVPRSRVQNELSRSDPPTPPRGPPPTPRRRDGDMFSSPPCCDPSSPSSAPRRYEIDIFNSLSLCDIPSPPDTPRHSEDYGLFNSLSRRDPPTPPRAPPPSPCRRNAFNSLSRRDPPTPPRGPPPSPRRHDTELYTELSRSNPPSPPRGPPPTPKRYLSGYSAWTPDEIDLLMFVCNSGVKLGWYQIAGLFHGKDVDVCRSKYREIRRSEEALLDQQKEPDSGSDDSESYREPLQLYIPTGVPGLSRGPSPVGSPICDRLPIRSWDFDSDVECAVDFKVPKKTKTIAHLSDELNFALEKEWDNVKGRVQDQHAFPSYPAGVNWAMAPGFLQMAEE